MRTLKYHGIATHIGTGEVLFELEYFFAESRVLAEDHFWHCTDAAGFHPDDVRVKLTPLPVTEADKRAHRGNAY